MQTQTISVKELRTNFPKIRKGLENGTSYTLIYRSKPIAEIKPISASYIAFQKLLKAYPKLSFKSRKSAVQLIREERD